MDTRINPQITEIKYNDYTQEYEMWTTDKFYFKFKSIPYTEYIEQVKSIISKEEHKMDQPHYRLYSSIEGHPYDLIVSTFNPTDIFNPLDECILQKELQHSRYLVIENIDNSDNVIYLGFGNKIDYLQFKRLLLECVQENITFTQKRSDQLRR